MKNNFFSFTNNRHYEGEDSFKIINKIKEKETDHPNKERAFPSKKKKKIFFPFQ